MTRFSTALTQPLQKPDVQDVGDVIRFVRNAAPVTTETAVKTTIIAHTCCVVSKSTNTSASTSISTSSFMETNDYTNAKATAAAAGLGSKSSGSVFKRPTAVAAAAAAATIAVRDVVRAFAVCRSRAPVLPRIGSTKPICRRVHRQIPVGSIYISGILGIDMVSCITLRKLRWDCASACQQRVEMGGGRAEWSGWCSCWW